MFECTTLGNSNRTCFVLKCEKNYRYDGVISVYSWPCPLTTHLASSTFVSWCAIKCISATTAT